MAAVYEVRTIPRGRTRTNGSRRTRPPSRGSSAQNLGLAAAGGVAVLRVTGQSLLGVTDAVAYRAFDQAERAVVGSNPLSLLTVAPAAAARIAYQAGSDLAHNVLGAP